MVNSVSPPAVSPPAVSPAATYVEQVPIFTTGAKDISFYEPTILASSRLSSQYSGPVSVTIFPGKHLVILKNDNFIQNHLRLKKLNYYRCNNYVAK